MNSFLAFQEEVEARSRKDHLPALNKLNVGHPQVNETDRSDTRNLLDRLLAPIESSSLVTHLQTRLSRKQELLLRLSYPGNLSSSHWENLFDPEDQEIKNENWSLTQEQTDQLIASLNTAAKEIGCEAGLLYSPLIHHHIPAIPLKAGQIVEDDAQRNDLSVDEQWSPRGLRVFIRSVPQDASDAVEVCNAV